MTLVVGYPPEKRDRAVLSLGAMLARSEGDDLVVCTVVPQHWQPGLAAADGEYQTWLDAAAEQALEQARSELRADLPAKFVAKRARSASSALVEVAEEHDASAIVVGSSAAGVFGHIAFGSVTDHLLHSSPVPVALATRGFRPGPGGRVSRITVAFGDEELAMELVVAAAAVASRTGVALRLASLGVQAVAPVTAIWGKGVDHTVAEQWAEGIRQAAQDALDQAAEVQPLPSALEIVLGFGPTWGAALDDIDWQEGDVLLVGSSTHGPAARVFLGSRATKIIRHSPVPVVIVPRAAVEDLAKV